MTPMPASGAHARLPLPPAPKLKKILGPSFILLGLGLGSGEVILWPYLASNYGLGLVWGMLLGITLQFFINMEVSRYALIHGESIFVGFAKRWGRWIALWFIVSTFLGFGWPGIGLAGATLLAGALGWDDVHAVAITVFLGIGFFLSVGRVLYKTVERLQKTLIAVGIPFIFLLAVALSSRQDIVALAEGLIGRGEGFWFLPAGVSLTAFLGALAYAGAGGNLNLAQSCYVRDKGYGMGAYADRITSVITGGGQGTISLKGKTFALTDENLKRFRSWWRVTNLEHLCVFWGLGLFTMLLLSLLSYATTFGTGVDVEGIRFILAEAAAIAQRTYPVFGMLFLLVTGVMLLATQLTVLDATSRIMTENVLLFSARHRWRVSALYYAILWLQILFGIAVFSLGFDQPYALIVLGAVFNAFTMFTYTGLLLAFNNRVLPKLLRPTMLRNGALTAAFLFLGFFCGVTVGSYLV